jgi:hypothetical protein
MRRRRQIYSILGRIRGHRRCGNINYKAVWQGEVQRVANHADYAGVTFPHMIHPER